MDEKLNHTVAIASLHDIITESEANMNSGDLRLVGEARRDYFYALILLTVLSNQDAESFNNTELAPYPTPEQLNAPDVAAPAAPQTPVNADDLSQGNSGTDAIVDNSSTAQNSTAADESGQVQTVPETINGNQTDTLNNVNGNQTDTLNNFNDNQLTSAEHIDDL